MSDKREQARQRLRTNEALEEALEKSEKRIEELELVIKDSIRCLELSEMPFFKGIEKLKETQK